MDELLQALFQAAITLARWNLIHQLAAAEPMNPIAVLALMAVPMEVI